MLRLRSPSHVSRLIAQCDRELRSDKQLRVVIDASLERLRRELVPVAANHRQVFPATTAQLI